MNLTDGGAIDITSGGTITLQDIHFDNNYFLTHKMVQLYLNSGSTCDI